MKLKLTLTAVAAAALAGCSTVNTVAPIEDHAEVLEPAAKTVPVEEGTSKTIPASPYLAGETLTDSGRTHTVVAGDTLYNIGVRYGVNPRELAALNGITDPTAIPLGFVMKLPETAVKAEETPVTQAPDQAVTGETIAVGAEETPAPEVKPVTIEVAKRLETPDEAAQRELAQQEKIRAAAAKGVMTLPWPATGTVIADFNATNHAGIDIAGNLGDPIKVVLDGTVHYVGNGAAKGYGNFVIVKHNVRLPGAGTTPLVTVYGNASQILVKMGESVRQGQTIALMGNSDADRVKLRFEMRQGAPVNPAKYLEAK